MQEPCSRPLLPQRGRLGRSTARMRGLAINSIRRGQGLYPRDNAVLERVLGNKGRAVRTVPELDAVLAWLEHDRLGDHLHLLMDDVGYARGRAGDRPGGHTPAGEGRGQQGAADIGVSDYEDEAVSPSSVWRPKPQAQPR